jgi:hypothetical protein
MVTAAGMTIRTQRRLCRLAEKSAGKLLAKPAAELPLIMEVCSDYLISALHFS